MKGPGGCAIGPIRSVIVALIALAATAPPAWAELRIDITQGRAEPLPIAIAEFAGASAEDAQFGRDISRVVSADLERSGLFRPLDARAFIRTEASVDVLPRFADWRVINAQALVHGVANTLADGRLRVQFRLWDVVAEQQMTGFVYQSSPAGWRRLAHLIADAVYERITGETGYFDTRIVYIAERGPKNRRIKRLAIMDQDGENHQFLTDGSNLVLTPRFSPTLQEITYLSYYRNVPRVYLFNIDT
ncbi:MAG TPA: TolB family protein, partial [Rhodospirillales bacterium]|nr:TolB family protein [Rhodospirillales bacterium]